jgi:transcriptional regulator with XRE-family HTH domain
MAPMKMSDQIRQAITESGLSRYRVAKESGVDEGMLSRFMAGSGARSGTLDKIAEFLGLVVRVDPQAKRRGQ